MLETAPTSRPLWLCMKAEQSTPDQILRHFRVSAPPIDVLGMAQSMGVQILHTTGRNWSGALRAAEDAATIYLADGDSHERQRFTIAHELGHLMLHPLGLEYRDLIDPTAPGSSVREREANAFAAELIMPEWLVRVTVDRLGSNIRALAEAFRVSESAMEYRLRALYPR
ncbi:MAG: hypothetical protein JWN04_3526 [Myxococcaceae bacterium]|nr:hypothetical protein [Myxococcaceae bacterium]